LENITPGTIVTTVVATDPDRGEYGSVIYSLYSWLSNEGKKED